MGSMSKVNALVHCHLCVLKDLCPFEASDESFKHEHTDWAHGLDSVE